MPVEDKVEEQSVVAQTYQHKGMEEDDARLEHDVDSPQHLNCVHQW